MSQTDCFWCGMLYDTEQHERCPNCASKITELKLLTGTSQVVPSENQDGNSGCGSCSGCACKR